MSADDKATELRPVMGFVDLLLFFVITSFGIMWVAKAAEAGAAGITYYVISGFVFYVPLAVSVLVLSARYPGEGGLYVWSQQSFGDFAGFITGWTYWACIIAFLPSVLTFIAGSLLFCSPVAKSALENDSNYFIAVSVIGIVVATTFNVVGLDIGKWLHNAGAFGTWLPALALTILAFVVWGRVGAANDLSPRSFVPDFSIKQAILWSVLIVGLTGLEAVPVLGDEIQDARRRLPPALLACAVLMIVSNVVVTLAVLVAFPAEEISGSPGFMQAFERASQRAGVGGLLPFVAVVVVIGHLGKVGAWSATAARLPFVAGIDRSLPSAFAQLHPRWGTPYIALIFQAIVVSAIVVLGQFGTTTKGAYDVLISMTIIPTFIPFLFLFAAAIKLQRGEPGPGRGQSPASRRAIAVLAGLGFFTVAASMILAVVPPESESRPGLYVGKVVGLAVVLVVGGMGIYGIGLLRRATP